MQKFNVKKLSVAYELDMSSGLVDVTIKCGRKTLRDEFYVQMTESEYNYPMGCWITTDISDGIWTLRLTGEACFDIAGAIITVAEQSYRDSQQEIQQ